MKLTRQIKLLMTCLFPIKILTSKLLLKYKSRQISRLISNLPHAQSHQK